MDPGDANGLKENGRNNNGFVDGRELNQSSSQRQAENRHIWEHFKNNPTTDVGPSREFEELQQSSSELNSPNTTWSSLLNGLDLTSSMISLRDISFDREFLHQAIAVQEDERKRKEEEGTRQRREEMKKKHAAHQQPSMDYENRRLDQLGETTNDELGAIWKHLAQIGSQHHADTQLILEHFKQFQRDVSIKIGALQLKFAKEEKERKRKEKEMEQIIEELKRKLEDEIKRKEKAENQAEGNEEKKLKDEEMKKKEEAEKKWKEGEEKKKREEIEMKRRIEEWKRQKEEEERKKEEEKEKKREEEEEKKQKEEQKRKDEEKRLKEGEERKQKEESKMKEEEKKRREEEERKQKEERKEEEKKQLDGEEKKRKGELAKDRKMRGKKRKAEEEMEQEEEKKEGVEGNKNPEKTADEGHFEEADANKLKKEKKDRDLEEQITEALIRKCARCGLAFMKDGGSNRVICHCGMTQCYICRQSNIDHDHFCKHPRDPNVTNWKCNQCAKKCMLYQDADQIDAELITQIRNRHEREEAGEGEGTSQN